MKKQLSSLDLNYIVKEIRNLEGSRIDKIYQPEKELLVLSLFKSGEGKSLLRIEIGKSIFIVQGKEQYDEILGFGQLLRKHLDGFFLKKIVQLKPERIIKFGFKAKEESKSLYVELFGKGNAILCDSNDVIINALEHHEFRERVIKPRLKYAYPMMSYDLFNIDEKKLSEAFSKTKKDSIVICLATELGLGGLYSEEACLLGGLDKSTNPKSAGENQIKSIVDSIRKITSHKTEPIAIFENDTLADVAPFDLKYYPDEKYKKQKFETFSEALAFFYSQFKEVKETEFEKKLKSLERIIGS